MPFIFLFFFLTDFIGENLEEVFEQKLWVGHLIFLPGCDVLPCYIAVFCLQTF